MKFADTHSHLYLPEFDPDRANVVANALKAGVEKILLPNIDISSVEPMLKMTRDFPGICYAMTGLHPTSVREDFASQIGTLADIAEKENIIAIGEIGIDLYWDKTFKNEQMEALRMQINLAIEKQLPVVIHCRESFNEIFEVLEEFRGKQPAGVFHAFSGSVEQAQKIISEGFYLGIGGIVTFKNSGLASVIGETGPEKLLLETDSPFLAPTPNRGKRNESAYIPIIAGKIASATGLSTGEIASITTRNAMKLFNLNT